MFSHSKTRTHGLISSSGTGGHSLSSITAPPCTLGLGTGVDVPREDLLCLGTPSPHSYSSHVDPRGALVPPTPSLSADTPTSSFIRKKGHWLGILLDAMPFLTHLSSSLEDGIFFFKKDIFLLIFID